MPVRAWRFESSLRHSGDAPSLLALPGVILFLAAWALLATACGSDTPPPPTTVPVTVPATEQVAPAPTATAPPATSTTTTQSRGDTSTTTLAAGTTTSTAPEPDPVPRLPARAVVTVRINTGPLPAFNLWAVAEQLGLPAQQDITLELSDRGFFPAAALVRGELDVIASCPDCLFPLYEDFPGLRNWMVSHQWTGLRLVGRYGTVPGAPGPRPWEKSSAGVGEDLAEVNRRFARSLAGWSVAVWDPGMTTYLEGLLEQGGLGLEDVELLGFADHEAAVAAFASGAGDLLLTDGKSAQELLGAPEAGADLFLAAPHEAFVPSSVSYLTFTSTGEWLDGNEETALRLMAIWYRAIRYLHERTDTVLDLLQSEAAAHGVPAPTTAGLALEMLDFNRFAPFETALEDVFGAGSATSFEASVGRAYREAVEAGVVAAGSAWRLFEVEEEWFAKLRSRADLVAWILSPLA